MKNVSGVFVSAVMTVVTATVGVESSFANSQLTEARMQGVWEVVARVCETSGNPARDAFVLGRDHMEIFVTGTSASLVTLIEGKEVDIWKGSFNTAHGYLVMRPSVPTKTDKRIAKVPFDITQYPTLIITTGGFGNGGSCAPGESLNTYFRLKGVTT